MYINGNIFLNNGSSKEKTVEWFEYSENLYKVLDQNGIISRMKNIPQLGVIKVNKKFYKSRFDYFFIQMYLHELIGKELKNKLEFSYNSTIKPEDFYEFDSMNLKQESLKIRHKEKDNLQYPTILNFLQLFTLVSNIGFFRNTFVSSYATIILANKNSDFKTLLFDSSDSKMFVELAEKIIIKEDYYHLNLLNAFLILEKCGINDGAVVYAKNLIYSYLNKDKLPSNSKLLVFFDYFKAVRDFSYMAYDLPIANVPLSIDLCDTKAIMNFFKEFIEQYNDNTPLKQWSKSVSKLLNDTLYSENSCVIEQYKIVRNMVSTVEATPCLNIMNYYDDFLLNKENILNKPTTVSKNENNSNAGILKITYSKKENIQYQNLMTRLLHTNCIGVGTYHRHDGSKTVLVNVKTNCKNCRKVAFHVFRMLISNLQSIENISNDDKRFLLVAKFFLIHYFDADEIRIKPTVDKEKCVVCDRGKAKRVKTIKDILHSSCAHEDAIHEIEHLKDCLIKDTINDTSVSIIGSVEVYKSGNSLCELDGLIIFPMREKEQVIFLEAKNTNKNAHAKKHLNEKLEKLNISYNSEMAKEIKRDVYVYVTVCDQ